MRISDWSSDVCSSDLAITGLITTEGFRDEIEYRRGYKEDIWDVRLAPPKEITPRRRRLTVPERVLFDGSVYKPLDEDAVRECCRRLRSEERRVGKECGRTCQSGGSPTHLKKNTKTHKSETPS